MNHMKSAEKHGTKLTIRPRRQVTLPAWVCEELGVAVGDQLAVSVDQKSLRLEPSESIAEAALRALQEAFAASGVSEEEFQEEGRRIREELYRRYYGED